MKQVIVPLVVFYAVLAGPIVIAWRARRRGDWPEPAQPHAGARAAAWEPRAFAAEHAHDDGVRVRRRSPRQWASTNSSRASRPTASSWRPSAEGAVLAFAIALPAFVALTLGEIVTAGRFTSHR